MEKIPVTIFVAVQMSEEETKAWQRGANSDASLRPYGPPGGKRPPSPVGRGRGRGGRGGGASSSSAHAHYDRNRSMDDDFAESGAPRGYGRGRSSSGLYERQTSERGGGWFDQGLERNNSRGGGLVEDELGGGGSASPRKGYTRAPFDDWRGMKAGGGGEGSEYKGGEDGWRTSGASSRGSKWGSNSGGGGTGSGAPNTWRSTERLVKFLFEIITFPCDTGIRYIPGTGTRTGTFKGFVVFRNTGTGTSMQQFESAYILCWPGSSLLPELLDPDNIFSQELGITVLKTFALNKVPVQLRNNTNIFTTVLFF
jgi:hypothetical protein